MATFGENLRREREMRGVTLEEISESTKISVRLLTAIEADDFSKLPGGVFTRSFIRNYSQYLGLDEEHVLAEYKRMAQPGSDNDLSRLTAGKPIPSKSGPQSRVLPWVVAAVLLSAGYAIYRHSHRSVEVPVGPSAMLSSASTSLGEPGPSSGAPEPQPNIQNPATPNNRSGDPNSNLSSTSPATAPSAGQGSPSGAMASTLASSPAGSAPPPAQTTVGEGDLLLQVATSDDVWLAVAADGKTVFQHLLPADSVRSFRAKGSFDVTTGNAQGTLLTLNGTPQKPLGRHGEFKKVHLTRDDFQNRTP